MHEQARDTNSQTSYFSQHLWALQTSSQGPGITFCIPCLVTWEFGSVGCQDSFENLEHLSLLYSSFGNATNLHPYSNNFFHRQIEVPMMLNKLENMWAWYVGGIIGKVKCLLYEASFVKKGTRMLSHLGYEGPNGIHDKGVSLCQRATPEIKRLFHEYGGVFSLYPERVGVAYLTQAVLLEWGDCMHCDRAYRSLFIWAQVVDRYKLKSKDHKRVRGKPIMTLQTQRNMLL